MAQFVFIATILWIYLISINSSYYILSNNKNIRIVSLVNDCTEGRIEFYNGSKWGTLTDCTKSFTKTKEICESLGFDTVISNWYGSNNYNKSIPLISPIVYTNINDCDLGKEDSICSQCSFTNNINSCDNSYDIYIKCANIRLNNEYNCISAMDYSNIHTESCSNMHMSTTNDSKKVLLTILAIAIFGSIFCVIIFATYSKYQDTKRLNKEKSSKFATVPVQEQEMQLVNTKDTYAPPPKNRFIYQERQAKKKSEYINRDMKDYNDIDINDDEEISHNNITGGYNMEEIIPSVSVIYNKNKSASESYARVTNMDEDEMEDIIVQYEESK